MQQRAARHAVGDGYFSGVVTEDRAVYSTWHVLITWAIQRCFYGRRTRAKPPVARVALLVLLVLMSSVDADAGADEAAETARAQEYLRWWRHVPGVPPVLESYLSLCGASAGNVDADA